MALSKDMVQEDDFATKREAYYVSKNWGEAKFTSQPESDTVMDDIEALFSLEGVAREQLRFRPEDHGGNVAGSLVVIDRDRETGGMFARLHEHKWWRDVNCIIIGTSGVPTRSTRRFIRKLSDDNKLPVYCFNDCDPYGISNIYRTLKVGSGNAVHLNKFFCVPQARYLGVTPQDILDFELQDATHPLKDVDVKRAKDALKNDPFFQAHKEWQKAIKMMLKMGVRAEQQALAKWGLNFVIEEYLPRKLAEPKKFLP
jgi:DNA topoisomerase-6 subunit A